jgi:hypothetical protein
MHSIEDDIATSYSFIRALLGPAAVAEDKTVVGRRVDMIGWVVDLDTRLVSISRRNFLKTVHAFCSFDIDGTTTEHQVEVMASLASRYAQLCRHMLPYTCALYTFSTKFNGSPFQRLHLTSAAKIEVALWRSYLVALDLDEAKAARPLESFRPRTASVLIEYDASLTGFAVGISTLDESGNVVLVSYTAINPPYPATTDSSYQNVYEYLAVLLGLLLAKRAGLASFNYDLVGDSVASLSWVAHDKVKSVLAMGAGLGFTTLSVDLDAQVASIRHIYSAMNHVYDKLSRGCSAEESGIDPSKQVFFDDNHPVVSYVRLCSPLCRFETPKECAFVLREFRSLLAASLL